MEGQGSDVYFAAVASSTELRWLIFERRLMRRIRIGGQAWGRAMNLG